MTIQSSHNLQSTNTVLLQKYRIQTWTRGYRKTATADDLYNTIGGTNNRYYPKQTTRKLEAT